MEIKRPTLLINTQKCKNNIRKMANKAKRSGVDFRPHFKTHQSHEIAHWFRELGVDQITVSSVTMAQYFALDGWKDITIAFPLNILEIDDVNELAQSISLNILLESKNTLLFAEENLKSEVGVFLKIDAGYHRTGIPIENTNEIDELMHCFSGMRKCHFKGLLVHNGHSYQAISKKEVENIHFDALAKMQALKCKYIQDYPNLILSFGDTPSMSVVNNFEGLDEIRPGNFVFYDLMQSQIGVCTEEEIAIVMACPVVAKHIERNQIVIYGGAVHLSKESVVINNQVVFGKLVFLENNQWIVPSQSYYLCSLSQEHGIVQLDEETMPKIELGQIVGILPVHSCLSADLQNSFVTESSQILLKTHI